MTLCGSWLRESTASPSLRDFWMNSLNALYAPVATRRAQKFPSAASLIRYPATLGCQGHRWPRVSATSTTRNLLMICSGVYFLRAISPLSSLRFQIFSSRVGSVLGGWSSFQSIKTISAMRQVELHKRCVPNYGFFDFDNLVHLSWYRYVRLVATDCGQAVLKQTTAIP